MTPGLAQALWQGQDEEAALSPAEVLLPQARCVVEEEVAQDQESCHP